MHLIKYALGALALLNTPSVLAIDDPQGNVQKLFTKGPAFARFPDSTIVIDSPDLGRTGSEMGTNFTGDGAGFFPALSWRAPVQGIREYVLISEDPDAPFNKPVLHGLYYGIKGVVTGLSNEDFVPAQKEKDPYLLKGHFKYGENNAKSPYLPPMPPARRGPHRYFFQLVGLSQDIDPRQLSEFAKLEEVARAIDGKILAWGAWVGHCERK